MPSSGMRREIARILNEEGYIEGFAVEQGRRLRHARRDAQVRPQPRARDQRAQAHLQARPPRLRASKDRPHKVLGGMGIAILSTSTGVVTGRQALERGVGGEVLCYVW